MVRDEDDIDVGTLVATPVGRLGVVMGISYGKRGDLARCRLRYLDSISSRETALLQPNLLRPIIKGRVFMTTIKRLAEDFENEQGGL